MAESCCTYMHEMDDVHRWLPSEILGDIGISESDTAERRRVAVVEDLAVRFAGVLGGGAGEMAAPCHRPQVRGGGATVRGYHALAGAGRPRRPGVAPPLYVPLPAPVAPWQVMPSGPENTTMVLSPAAAGPQPSLAPAANHPHPHPLLRGGAAGAVTGAAQPATTRRSGGTGFFLPRTAAADPRHANHHAPAAEARPHTNVPASQCRAQRHRRGNEAAAAMARRQQELRQAMAANVAQMQQLAVAGAPAPSCPDLALPQEWTY